MVLRSNAPSSPPSASFGKTLFFVFPSRFLLLWFIKSIISWNADGNRRNTPSEARRHRRPIGTEASPLLFGRQTSTTSFPFILRLVVHFFMLIIVVIVVGLLRTAHDAADIGVALGRASPGPCCSPQQSHRRDGSGWEGTGRHLACYI